MTTRVLLVHRYFWPDVPTYAAMLRLIGGHLASTGVDVSVFCGPVTYNGVYQGPRRPKREHIDGMNVYRVALPPDDKQRPALRAISLLWFAVRLVAHVTARRRAYDMITITTVPPVMMGLAARLIRWLTRVPYVYHCMDLYPEVAEVSGMTPSRRLSRIVRRIDATTCRRAAAVVVLSADMRATLMRRGLDDSNIVVLNNFDIIDEDPRDAVDVLSDEPSVYRIVFAGNLGRFQGLDALMDSALRVLEARPHAEFVFMGAGVGLGMLKAKAGGHERIRFLDHQSVSTAARALEHCQLGVVSLSPNIYRVAYPSKTATYLAAGCRLLVVVERESQLAQLVHDEGLGTTCAPADPDALDAALLAEIDGAATLAVPRDRIRAVGEKQFGRAAKLNEWARLVTTLGAPRD